MVRKELIIILIIVLAATTGILAAQDWNLQKTLAREQAALAQNALDRQTLSFLQMFVSKVLGAQGTVSFDDRLVLENAVRGLNDSAILSAWDDFVNSQTPAAAQAGVKNLLELLVQKIAA